jgi:hypothetical protein
VTDKNSFSFQIIVTILQFHLALGKEIALVTDILFRSRGVVFLKWKLLEKNQQRNFEMFFKAYKSCPLLTFIFQDSNENVFPFPKSICYYLLYDLFYP